MKVPSELDGSLTHNDQLIRALSTPPLVVQLLGFRLQASNHVLREE
jgi:hypothetical protein